ncbi:MAG: hypothetical protein FJZ01_02575 [Candidatus Sericytochromatia bacterium]|nr:hypothetical protein [Candidatus Tanganyikabacteria bacterium]
MRRGLRDSGFRVAVAGLLVVAALGPGCAAVGVSTGMAADRAAGMPGSSRTAGEEFVLLPRSPGEKATDLVRGQVPLTAGDPFAGAPSAGATPLPTASNNSGSLAGDNGETGAGGCQAGATAPLGVYLAGDRVLLASAKGLHAYSSGSWTTLADPFPCGTAPSAIAAASGSYYAGAADGIYRLAAGSRTWTRVVQAGRIADLDVTPDASAGMAVEEGGRPWRFDGQAWASQSLKLAPLLGSVRTLSASESYAVGSDGAGTNVVGKWNGAAWSSLSQPDSLNPATALAVRRQGAPVLVATTRSGLYRLAGASWVAELGPDASYYLGVPTFGDSGGFVADLGAAAGRTFAYLSGKWQAEAPAPEPLETVVALPGGGAIALAADGESLHAYGGGTWKRLATP